jgi:SAM-dependent methyltransferase
MIIQPLSSSVLAPELGYDKIAGSYDRWKWQAFWEFNEKPLIASLLRTLKASDAAIDLGLGTGRYVELLQEFGIHNAFGVDVSAAMLKIARRRVPGARLIRADLTELPLAAGSLDLAIAARSLCHVDDLSRALNGIANSLRPNGSLIVTELDAEHRFENTTAPSPEGDVSIATWKRTPQEIVSAAAGAGLSVATLRRLRATDCVWLPPAPELASIDRSGRRAIFLIAVFSKLERRYAACN